MTYDEIVSLLARMTRRRAQEILPTHSLGSLGLSRSFGLGALRSQLEAKHGSKLGVLQPQTTVEALQRMLTAAEAPVKTVGPPAAKVERPPSTSRSAMPVEGIGLGMDIQEQASLPHTNDYRSDEFYSSHFTPAEISFAVLKPSPRKHFCGLFCAKEAAKKAHPALLSLRMQAFEVQHDAHGKPALQLLIPPEGTQHLRFVLSITHTEQFSAATCLVIG